MVCAGECNAASFVGVIRYGFLAMRYRRKVSRLSVSPSHR
jgi:hypothetical protein